MLYSFVCLVIKWSIRKVIDMYFATMHAFTSVAMVGTEGDLTESGREMEGTNMTVTTGTGMTAVGTRATTGIETEMVATDTGGTPVASAIDETLVRGHTGMEERGWKMMWRGHEMEQTESTATTALSTDDRTGNSLRTIAEV